MAIPISDPSPPSASSFFSTTSLSRCYLSEPACLASPRDLVKVSHRGVQTLRGWAARYRIGVDLNGRWLIHKVGLRLLLEGEDEALRAFVSGDRSHPTIVAAYRAERLPLPRAIEAA